MIISEKAAKLKIHELLDDWNWFPSISSSLSSLMVLELFGWVAGLEEDIFPPLDIIYTEQNSGAILETEEGTSGCKNVLLKKKLTSICVYGIIDCFISKEGNYKINVGQGHTVIPIKWILTWCTEY